MPEKRRGKGPKNMPSVHKQLNDCSQEDGAIAEWFKNSHSLHLGYSDPLFSDLFIFFISDNRTSKDRNLHRTTATWDSLLWR